MSVTRRSALWGLPIAALFLTSPVFAEEPPAMLKRMVEAAREQSYSGSFVYERTGSFSTHQVWRQRDAGQTSERLLQTDGEPQEWLTRDGDLVCTTAVVSPAAWKATGQLSDQVELLHNWYSLQMLGATRVANRPVFVLAVKPRDPYRYAYELYLDQETGLLLKSLLISDRDVLLERFQFASLNLGQVAADAMQTSNLCLPMQADTQASVDAGDEWVPGWLPPGFILGHSESRALETGPGQVITQVFTDGLARLTLFVEPLTADVPADDLRAQLGPTVAISRKLERPDGVYLATVVGEVPAAAAERVADSFMAEAESAQP